MKKKGLWHSNWGLSLLLMLALLLVFWQTSIIQSLERRFYDAVSVHTATKPNTQIAIIAIDEQSIANIGRWPWPRQIHARMIEKLGEANARSIGYTVLFSEAQSEPGLVYVRKIKSALPPNATQAKALAEQAEKELNADAQLAQAIGKAQNVVLPAIYEWNAQPGVGAEPQLPPYPLPYSQPDPQELAAPVALAAHPVPELGEKAAAIAHVNQWKDVDGWVREQPLYVNYYGQAMPSMPLVLAARALNLPPSGVQLQADQVQLGKLRLATDAHAFMLPQFYPMQGSQPAFAVDSFYDVLMDKIPASKYAGKTVIVGATAQGISNLLDTPAASNLSPAELLAHNTSALLQGQYFVKPVWGFALTLLACALVFVYLSWLLPYMRAARAAIFTTALLVLLLALEYGLLAWAHRWVMLVLPALFLVLGHILFSTKRYFFTEVKRDKAVAESAETNRMMGLALQSQGRLDEAWERYRRVGLKGDARDEALLDNLYSLALDFERKRQFNKTEDIYAYISGARPDYRDIQAKLKRARNLSETVIFGTGSSGPAPTGIILDDGTLAKPTLGRYVIEKELGKGAMGTVYLGRDARIGRTVAIKTVALKQEFEGDALDEARTRFFREAETAGQLQHPNIVTIYDAGEEHDLAYIAMELLKGEDLSRHARPDTLLPVPVVLSILARVADALHFAHQHQVVHRDIKPANIMYDAASDSVKVTDFGIARIAGSDKTKTGMVLGTPSFMAPEQIQGLEFDGRADIYALGVTMYQLLSGHLPYTGQSLAELMYKITQNQPTSLSEHRPDLPAELMDLVHKALERDAAARWQNGEEFALAIRQAAQTDDKNRDVF